MGITTSRIAYINLHILTSGHKTGIVYVYVSFTCTILSCIVFLSKSVVTLFILTNWVFYVCVQLSR